MSIDIKMYAVQHIIKSYFLGFPLIRYKFLGLFEIKCKVFFIYLLFWLVVVQYHWDQM